MKKAVISTFAFLAIVLISLAVISNFFGQEISEWWEESRREDGASDNISRPTIVDIAEADFREVFARTQTDGDISLEDWGDIMEGAYRVDTNRFILETITRQVDEVLGYNSSDSPSEPEEDLRWQVEFFPEGRRPYLYTMVEPRMDGPFVVYLATHPVYKTVTMTMDTMAMERGEEKIGGTWQDKDREGRWEAYSLSDLYPVYNGSFWSTSDQNWYGAFKLEIARTP